MDAEGSSSVTPQKIPRGLTTALVSTVLEWLLLSMLFVDAIFAFIIAKYARYCKLQTPCLLCSRLDHVFGREKRGYYWDLICGTHKLEISSLIICRSHNKLVNIHQICESCLSSFATTSQSNSETCRLLEGESREEHDSCCDQTFFSTKCSCCSVPLVSEGRARQSVQAKSMVFDQVSEVDVPLSGNAAVSNDNDVKQIKNDFVGATSLVNSGADPLSYIGYSELKVCDTESEVPLLDNDEATAVACEADSSKDLHVRCVEKEPLFITLAEGSSFEKLIDQASVTESPVSEPQVQSTVSNDNALGELNRQQVAGKSDPSLLCEPIPFDIAPPSSNGTGSSVEESNESLNVTSGEIRQKSALGPEKVFEPDTVAVTGTSTVSEITPISVDDASQSSNLLDLGDAYKFALENKGKQLSDVLSEQWAEKDCSKVSADLRRLLSQLSTARGFDQSINDISPKLLNGDEMKPSDVSNSIGMHILQKRISLERNESSLSLDGSIVSMVSEVEGESVVDRLRRQIEHDRKSMITLYKELEEERNASAIAANQALAMITKQQEEKAALNMEASQYLRMMEEQSEYDTETLQKLSDLLAEKEREIQNLEEELEYYKKHPNESTMKNESELISDMELTNAGVEHSEVSADGAAIHRNSIAEKDLSSNESMATVAKSLLEFEDDSSYILHSLKKLEKKLLLFSNNGIHSDLDSSEYLGNEELKEVNSAEGCLPSVVDCKLINKENDDLICGESDLSSIRNEVCDLNDRLRALEEDRNFLEHAINSLRNGNEGLQFIQEIASHLCEIRKIGTSGRHQSLA